MTTVKEKHKTIDPRAVPGAYVKTPGNLKAYVVKADPKDSDRVIIEYAVKGMGTDSYQIRSLTLIQGSPEAEAKQIEGDVDRQCDCDGNPLEIDDHVKIVELKGRSRLLLNATATIVELNDGGAVRCRIKLDSTGTVLAWNPEWLQKLSEEIAPLEQSPLDILATEINQLYSECEEAIAVAKSAEQSALEHAKLCGQKLLEAKKACGHGKWEQWRNEHLLLPSSTDAGAGMPLEQITELDCELVAEHLDGFDCNVTFQSFSMILQKARESAIVEMSYVRYLAIMDYLKDRAVVDPRAKALLEDMEA